MIRTFTAARSDDLRIALGAPLLEQALGDLVLQLADQSIREGELIEEGRGGRVAEVQDLTAPAARP